MFVCFVFFFCSIWIFNCCFTQLLKFQPLNFQRINGELSVFLRNVRDCVCQRFPMSNLLLLCLNVSFCQDITVHTFEPAMILSGFKNYFYSISLFCVAFFCGHFSLQFTETNVSNIIQLWRFTTIGFYRIFELSQNYWTNVCLQYFMERKKEVLLQFIIQLILLSYIN